MNDYIELVDEGTNPLMPDTDMNDLVECADRPSYRTVCPCPAPLWPRREPEKSDAPWSG